MVGRLTFKYAAASPAVIHSATTPLYGGADTLHHVRLYDKLRMVMIASAAGPRRLRRGVVHPAAARQTTSDTGPVHDGTPGGATKLALAKKMALVNLDAPPVPSIAAFVASQPKALREQLTRHGEG
jgi:hypothetical protein